MIYLDNAATTEINEKILEEMNKILKNHFANPSSLYDFGMSSEKIIENSRKTMSELLKVSSNEIYFTPSGTFGNNTAIFGSLTSNEKEEFITNPMEHPSVLNPYKKINRSVHYLKLNDKNQIDLKDLKNLINQNTRLVSVMHVNNEIGVLNDVEKIGKMIKEVNPHCLFHVDGVQAFGKIPVSIKKSKIDIYTASAHKIHGPKGIGFMYINKNASIQPIIFGGGQEHGMYSGTENIGHIYAFGECAKIAFQNQEENFKKLYQLKEFLLEGLKAIEDYIVFSPLEDTSPYITYVCFKDIMSEVLLHYLEQDEIYISTGSACSKGKISAVSKYLKIPEKSRNGCIRVSFTDKTTKDEITSFLSKLKEYIYEIRKVMKR